MRYDNEIQSSNTQQPASNGFVDDEGKCSVYDANASAQKRENECDVVHTGIM